MGYYTAYEIDVLKPNEVDEEEICKYLESLDLPDFGKWHGGWCAYGKWYEHEDDLKKLSLLFPDVVFRVYGDGEESDDIWYKYFKNGKVQYCPCHFSFDPYDEAKLE